MSRFGSCRLPVNRELNEGLGRVRYCVGVLQEPRTTSQHTSSPSAHDAQAFVSFEIVRLHQIKISVSSACITSIWRPVAIIQMHDIDGVNGVNLSSAGFHRCSSLRKLARSLHKRSCGRLLTRYFKEDGSQCLLHAVVTDARFPSVEARRLAVIVLILLHQRRLCCKSSPITLAG